MTSSSSQTKYIEGGRSPKHSDTTRAHETEPVEVNNNIGGSGIEKNHDMDHDEVVRKPLESITDFRE